MSIFEIIINHYNSQIDAISRHTEALTPYIAEAAHLLAHTLQEDGKILCAAAGHNYAIAQHACNELDSLNQHRPALPCILLGNSQGMAAAIDQDEEQVQQYYARQVSALGQAGDTLLVLAHSGQETSLIHAIQAANSRGLSVLIINSSEQSLAPVANPNHVSIDLHSVDKAQALSLQFITLTLLIELTEQLLFGTIE